MKNLEESLKTALNENLEDKFNDWLSDRYGADDLYVYFSDLLTEFYFNKVTKQNWAKLSDECYEEHAAPDIVRNAKEFKLDPQEVCDSVFRDNAV